MVKINLKYEPLSTFKELKKLMEENYLGILHTNKNDEYYIAIFRDYGPGISNKDIPFIYEKYKVDNNMIRIKENNLNWQCCN